MPLKRLLSRLMGEPPPGELAGDDWAPVPVTAVARPDDTVEWLQEPDGDVMPMHPLGPTVLPDTGPTPQLEHLQCFTPEELAIIDRQQRERPAPQEPKRTDNATSTTAAEGPRPTIDSATTAPEPVGTPPHTPVPAAESAPAPAQRPPPDGRWVDVLRSCGEHLSDMELKIIRQQLASS
jgi:hypothetical protein